MVKLVDAEDSKSSEPCARVGSIPTSGTNDFKGLANLGWPLLFGKNADCAQNCAHFIQKVTSDRLQGHDGSLALAWHLSRWSGCFSFDFVEVF